MIQMTQYFVNTCLGFGWRRIAKFPPNLLTIVVQCGELERVHTRLGGVLSGIRPRRHLTRRVDGSYIREASSLRRSTPLHID
jgi:hypothetical protein